MKKLAAWGDSITWGAFDEHGGWINRLRDYIDLHYGGEPEIFNLGIRGEKVKDVLARFDHEYKALRPDAIILAIGINDSPHRTYPGGTPLAIFEQNFNKLVKRMKLVCDEIIILSPTAVDDRHQNKHGYKIETIRPYAEIIKKIAAQNDLIYVDLLTALDKNDLVIDGLHPNGCGHEKIFQKVLAAVDLKGS